MAKLVWDVLAERTYELGVDHGVLYLDGTGTYDNAYVWNGLVSVQQNAEGGEPNDKYADNIKYFSLQSAEQYKATVEAFTYPEEFAECDGSKAALTGVYFGQQPRKSFGFSYRTKIGNAAVGDNAGYKIHLVYGLKASPSDRSYETVNDSPDAITFSWEFDSTPVPVTGPQADNFQAVSHIEIDSTKLTEGKLTAIENVLYGTDASQGQEATTGRLPLPAEVLTIISSAT